MLVRIIMRNKKVVKILCVILAAAMPVSSGVGVQAAQAGAVAATADRQMMCRMQQKLRQRILRRMQIVTIWKVHSVFG